MKRRLAVLLMLAVLAGAGLIAFNIGLDDKVFEITGFAVSNAEGADYLAPADRILESQIKASDDAVLIKIANSTVGKLENTNSMRPVLDSSSSAIMIKPGKAEEVREGDIIAYYSGEAAGLVAHRVVAIGRDEKGWFAITKGDNAAGNDPEKVRFEQVMYVIVGILY